MPFDSEKLAEAHTLRGALLAAQAESLRAFQQDLDEASFFMTRGTFERVARGVDQVIQLYGEHNLEDAAAAKALRDRALERLQQIDGAERGAQRERLLKLVDALKASKTAQQFSIVPDPRMPGAVRMMAPRNMPTLTTPPGGKR